MIRNLIYLDDVSCPHGDGAGVEAVAVLLSTAELRDVINKLELVRLDDGIMAIEMHCTMYPLSGHPQIDSAGTDCWIEESLKYSASWARRPVLPVNGLFETGSLCLSNGDPVIEHPRLYISNGCVSLAATVRHSDPALDLLSVCDIDRKTIEQWLAQMS